MPKLITPEKLNQMKVYVNEASPFNCQIYPEHGKCPPFRSIYIADTIQITMKGVRFAFDVRRIRGCRPHEQRQRMAWLEGIVREAIYHVLD